MNCATICLLLLFLLFLPWIDYLLDSSSQRSSLLTWSLHDQQLTPTLNQVQSTQNYKDSRLPNFFILSHHSVSNTEPSLAIRLVIMLSQRVSLGLVASWGALAGAAARHWQSARVQGRAAAEVGVSCESVSRGRHTKLIDNFSHKSNVMSRKTLF